MVNTIITLNYIQLGHMDFLKNVDEFVVNKNGGLVDNIVKALNVDRNALDNGKDWMIILIHHAI